MTGLVAAVAGTALLAAAPAASAATGQQLRFRTFNVPGATSTELFSINDEGEFTGLYTDPAGVHGFIQEGSHLTRFNYPGTSYTIASRINNHGTVVGWYQGSHGPSRGFVRSAAGHFTSLTDPFAGTGRNQGTFANGVTDQGVIVGNYITSGNIFHGFIYTTGRFTTVDVPGAFYGKPDWGSAVYDVNDAGVMVGIYTPSRKNVLEGFIETAGHFTKFIAPGAGTRPGDDTLPEGISNTGAIAGASLAGSQVYHGWLLSHGHYTPLNDPLATTSSPNGKAAGTIPAGVNRQGVVVGGYFDKLHIEHGFMVKVGSSQASSAPTATYAMPSSATSQRQSGRALGAHGALPGAF